MFCGIASRECCDCVSQYKARIDENQAEVLVLRIPVDDKDEKKTKNWNAKFVITEGNENGNFRIDTDPETNEGLLYVVKVRHNRQITDNEALYTHTPTHTHTLPTERCKPQSDTMRVWHRLRL